MYRETREDDCFSPSLPFLQSRLCVFTIRRNLLKMPGVYIFLNNVRSLRGAVGLAVDRLISSHATTLNPVG